MISVTMHEAKTQLSKLVEAALRGEEVVIRRGDKPVARLTALSKSDADHAPRLRPGRGALKGLVAQKTIDHLSRDWTPEELAEMFGDNLNDPS